MAWLTRVLPPLLSVTFMLGASATVTATPAAAQPVVKAFRPPAVPLVTSDPYLSIWSEADRLTDDVTRHWTGRPNPLVSLIRVDGKTYRLMGPDPHGIPALPQVGLQVLPTRTIYDFADSAVHVKLTFMTPALPSDLPVLARPVTYITWAVASADGADHAVSIYDSASAEMAVDHITQFVAWKRQTMGPLTAMRMGTQSQLVLVRGGDDTRIDWGYAYLAASTRDAKAAIGASNVLITAFIHGGVLPAEDDTRMPRAARDGQPTMALAFDLGKVGAAPVSRHAMIAYDEIDAIKFFGQKLRPYWRRDGAEPADLLEAAEHDYQSLTQRCEAFDHELMADLTAVGGARYAPMAALAYRQCLAGNGLAADANKQPLFFTKENTSGGDIATVDVIFPMDPIWVFLSPTLAKASLQPVFEYASSKRWKFPCSPHDLGTYPIARGTDNGGEAMPVEESGNVLILCDAIAKAEGNPEFASLWWPQLTRWAQYLEQFGLDPGTQLCTDDFMGFLAHNSNLSVKAIVALAAYGDLCKMRGDDANARRYAKLAHDDAQHWLKAAADGDHTNLAFDKPHTWSQKYNLVWDRILGLHVFPPSVAAGEIAYYKTVMNKYGVPLDSRTHVTKTDWSFWSATLALDQRDFEDLTSPIYDYLNHTTARLPFVDYYVTDNVKSSGMHARPVIGGVFIKMLTDRAVWKKWASRNTAKVGNWAPFPPQPTITPIMPTSEKSPQLWRYTVQAPPAQWTQAGFDDHGWRTGPGLFGHWAPSVRTPWNTGNIWIRRAFIMPPRSFPHPQFLVFHNQEIEIYINGTLAARESGEMAAYDLLAITPEAQALLQPGRQLTIAAHCRHTTSWVQGIDIGLVNVTDAGK